MTKPIIPEAALDDRLGFIGTSGSGKTYNAGGQVERLLRSRARVVIVDPLGVWWGLRLLADGKRRSPYDVAIFGGQRGDLPLTEHAGALIGETAATMAESCIIDLTQLGTKASERRFMTGFLDAIYRKARGEPFHLVVDEADLFAPQKPPKGDETLLNLMEQIVRRGRVKGFIPWLISQRPAVLNKNVLSQVDGLVAFKLTASQDRDALDDWIEGQADKAQGKAIKDALPTMQVGQGVVWVPGRGILTEATFPPKETYDSSRTPKRGEKAKHAAALEPLDVEALKARLGTVAKEAEANNPAKLRAELAAAKAKIAQIEKHPPKAAPAPAPKKGDTADLKRNLVKTRRALELAMKFITKITATDFLGKDGVDQERLQAAIKAAIDRAAEQFDTRLDSQRKAFEKWRADGEQMLKDLEKLLKSGEVHIDVTVQNNQPFTVTPAVARRHDPVHASARKPASEPGAPMSKVARSILTVLAQRQGKNSTRGQIAVLSGYSVSSSTFANGMSECRVNGWLIGSVDTNAITDAGVTALGAYDPLPTGAALRDWWMGRLDKAERTMLAAICAIYPGSLTKEALEQKTGYSATSSTFANSLSGLRVRELITRGEIKASDDLFE